MESNHVDATISIEKCSNAFFWQPIHIWKFEPQSRSAMERHSKGCRPYERMRLFIGEAIYIKSPRLPTPSPSSTRICHSKLVLRHKENDKP